MKFLATCLIAAIVRASHLTYPPKPTGEDLVALEAAALASLAADKQLEVASYNTKVTAGDDTTVAEKAAFSSYDAAL